MEQICNDIHEDKTMDSSMLFIQEDHDHLPDQFIWSNDPHVSQTAIGVLDAPIIDLQGFFRHDKEATLHAANLVKKSCVSHGVFQIVNHGIDPSLLALVDEHARAFFKLPITEKLKYKKKEGSVAGFTSAHAHRFAKNLPWKEMLTLEYHENGPDEIVADFFKSASGGQLKETGLIYQNYCHSLKKLALDIFELLDISLGGVDGHQYYRELFKDCISLLRCNYYPRCNQPNLTNGVGPHCDPTTITLLYQDQVGGLEVFNDNKWKSVPPHRDALVVILGDTFKALSNGKYQSCLHRVIVNNYTPRLSLAFFVNPRGDKVLKPPQQLIEEHGGREYPDFTWEEYFYFTQKHYRPDGDTLENFTKWLSSKRATNI
ncbi:hypothetical protein L1887_32761 [Cichorium endivia]|nr:hypothetical protein L1887_32761 [Cichorium endivia]